MTMPAFDDLVTSVEERSPDRLQQVAEAVAVADDLGQLGDRLVTHFVTAAREGGCSWSQIGAELGVSKQAAQQGFSAPAPPRMFGRRRGAGGPGLAFRTFSDDARAVLMQARDEARSLGHDHVGTEHFLLALVGPDGGRAASTLQAMGVTAERARGQVEAMAPRGGGSGRHVPFTPRAKKVLQLGVREAMRLGQRCAGPEHLLLAMLRDGEGVGTRSLAQLGVDLGGLRRALGG